MQEIVDPENFIPGFPTLREKLSQRQATASQDSIGIQISVNSCSYCLPVAKGSTQNNEPGKKMVFRFRKSELKRAAPESLGK